MQKSCYSITDKILNIAKDYHVNDHCIVLFCADDYKHFMLMIYNWHTIMFKNARTTGIDLVYYRSHDHLLLITLQTAVPLKAVLPRLPFKL